ncbi:DUF4188 domain-containing protein [Deinococcus yavapaiensis]|uniref:Uncharacterized protein DUF4188 n=1 Tax=Deinococcus yavapaiensis KR-236 TaxID=694435 RepID=A0A318SG71_9DEIO|nr:DUF4188 domain-containing protein [Deinococcus yavapaiensis]PYE48655.1 uncharacterized protein DUF4188 [Deinococcus yavapaiensis KR-236]
MNQPAAPRPETARMTAELDGDFVVFLIGMQINRPWRVQAWLPVLLAMPRMLRELQEQPQLGCLASWNTGFTVVQYWRSTEHLMAYARARDHQHLPAWQAFNRRARRAAGDVGIWHETFRVQAGAYETVYVGTGPRGLGRAGNLHPATHGRATAEGRLRGAPTS